MFISMSVLILLSLPLLLLLPNLHTASMTRHSTVTVTETQDVTMYYWRQKMSRISGLSLYMCLYWLLCYDCGGCRLLALPNLPPPQSPHHACAQLTASWAAQLGPAGAGAGVNIDTLCVMFIHQEGCPTCSNICLKTWIVTLIFTNKYICVPMMRA